MENWEEMKLSFQNTFKIKHRILKLKKKQYSKDKCANITHNYQEQTSHMILNKISHKRINLMTPFI